ncbi:hypothetical protein M407DRAFT_115169 [Tulasnella calospora MUT 4182]|uniref:Uncharacterized protein n=1 Tax=Tulasnella calospora MUT 4182 TaxID=1051891 RepID=A0A0C3Q2R6_9AGAM|nr:hypothetical protein M407DRAFT_115169 [Tulasnella calospora MUT 4182]
MLISDQLLQGFCVCKNTVIRPFVGPTLSGSLELDQNKHRCNNKKRQIESDGLNSRGKEGPVKPRRVHRTTF